MEAIFRVDKEFYMNYMLGSTKALRQDPCPVGLPEIFASTQIGAVRLSGSDAGSLHNLEKLPHELQSYAQRAVSMASFQEQN